MGERDWLFEARRVTLVVSPEDANVIFHALNYTALGRGVSPTSAAHYRRVRDFIEKQMGE